MTNSWFTDVLHIIFFLLHTLHRKWKNFKGNFCKERLWSMISVKTWGRLIRISDYMLKGLHAKELISHWYENLLYKSSCISTYDYEVIILNIIIISCFEEHKIFLISPYFFHLKEIDISSFLMSYLSKCKIHNETVNSESTCNFLLL